MMWTYPLSRRDDALLNGETLMVTLCHDVDILVPRCDDGTDLAKIVMDPKLTMGYYPNHLLTLISR